MKSIAFAAALIIVIVIYSAVSFLRKVHISSELAREAVPFTMVGDGSMRLLVLGDSTAVGVGANKSEDTLAALVAGQIKATDVENHALSGARTADLASEIAEAKSDHYHYVLIGIGANDVVRFESAREASQTLATALKLLPPHDHLVLYMAGNVGGSQLFPRILDPQYTARTLAYHAAFAPIVEAAGGRYVNLYIDPAQDPFAKRPEMYLAADGFHPSSAGYALWFEKIRTVLQ